MNEINHHLAIYKIAKNKFNVEEGSIFSNGDSFKLVANSGEIYTDKDFTKAEFDKAEIQLESEKSMREAEAATKRQALLDKLGITEEEAKLLFG
jgi:hypothetical protein